MLRPGLPEEVIAGREAIRCQHVLVSCSTFTIHAENLFVYYIKEILRGPFTYQKEPSCYEPIQLKRHNFFALILIFLLLCTKDYEQHCLLKTINSSRPKCVCLLPKRIIFPENHATMFIAMA